MVLLLGGMLAFGTGAAQADLLGVNWLGNVYSIDETTGVVTFIGASGFTDLNSLAADSTGTIYTVSGVRTANDYTSQLLMIDPVTGAGIPVAPLNIPGAIGPDYNGVRGLAFSSSDVLYAVIDSGFFDPNWTGQDWLCTIDVITGNVTAVGPSQLWGLQGLGMTDTDQVFAWDVGPAFQPGLEFVELGLATGVLIDDVVPGEGDLSIQALEWDGAGLFYAVGANDLFTIDPLLGDAMPLVPLSQSFLDFRGIVFVDPIPEPATLALMGLGLTGLLLRRKRQH